MTGYTSGKASHDPEPWKSQYGNRYNAPWSFGERIEFTRDPRAQFDNHNPILVRVRETMDAFTEWRETLRNLDDAEALDFFIPSATPAHIAHARRVLSKLAALS